MVLFFPLHCICIVAGSLSMVSWCSPAAGLVVGMMKLVFMTLCHP